jgi:hypothetical protein
MISDILRGAHRLDACLRLRLGRPYHVVLGLGLIEEIGRHLRELGEVGGSGWGIGRILLLVVFYSLLLVHQLGELHGHAERRQRASRSADSPPNFVN